MNDARPISPAFYPSIPSKAGTVPGLVVFKIRWGWMPPFEIRHDYDRASPVVSPTKALTPQNPDKRIFSIIGEHKTGRTFSTMSPMR